MQPLIEWFVDAAAAACDRGEPVPARALLTLLELPSAESLRPCILQQLDARLQTRQPALVVQATLLGLCVSAAAIANRPHYLDQARRVANLVTKEFAHPGGGFTAEAGGRGEMRAIDGNAKMTTALLDFASAIGDQFLARKSMTDFESLVLSAYRPGRGLAHTAGAGDADAERRLNDQVAVAETMLAAYALGGDETHLMMAEELILFSVRVLWDDQLDSFSGASIAEAGDAACVLIRLADATRRSEHRDRAERIVRALAPRCPNDGLDAAPVVSAAAAIC